MSKERPRQKRQLRKLFLFLLARLGLGCICCCSHPSTAFSTTKHTFFLHIWADCRSFSSWKWTHFCKNPLLFAQNPSRRHGADLQNGGFTVNSSLPDWSFDLSLWLSSFLFLQLLTKSQRHCQADKNVFSIATAHLKRNESRIFCAYFCKISHNWI